MVSRTVRQTRRTREATSSGTGTGAPAATIASTRSSAASRSSLVGTRGSSTSGARLGAPPEESLEEAGRRPCSRHVPGLSRAGA